ncbi:MAG: hypothetical protein M3Y56_04605 [Armatimonadota bacterium]|nr:hypothetical protein [Armatimonadota bacterium]
MELAFRQAVLDDFEAFYDACFDRDRDDAWLREIVGQEWRVLLTQGTAITMVVEDREQPPERRLIGCGQLVFVTDPFVKWARSSPSPQVNRQVTHFLEDGSSPLMTPNEVARANAGTGLNGLFTRWGQARLQVAREEQVIVGRFMHDAFATQSRGYQIKELLIEAIGEAARDRALCAGFLDRNDARRDQGDYPSLPHRHFLMGMTREEAFANEGSVISHFFFYSRPRFGLTPAQQTLLGLCLAQQEASDEALAQALSVPLVKVKNEWRALYRRVMDVDPDLLPLPEGRERGPEKKRRLLHYLRQHPEELRLYKPRGKG